MYQTMNENESYDQRYFILYNYDNGWCIKKYPHYDNEILYYSDTHTENPPDDISIEWYVETGEPPAPKVELETRNSIQCTGPGI